MKLVEILVEHFNGIWPDDEFKSICQDVTGETWLNLSTGNERCNDRGYWLSDVYDYTEDLYLTVAEDCQTAVVTKEIFDKFVGEQKVKSVKIEKYTEDFKKECVKEYFEDCYDTKTELCNNKGISMRSLNRWIDLYEDEVDIVDYSEKTPFERLGYSKDQLFVTIESSTFSNGSIVKLYRDGGSDCPLFLLVEGETRYHLCDGKEGAYIHLGHIEPFFKEEPKEPPVPVTYMGTSDAITLYRGEESVTVHSSSKNYENVMSKILNGDLRDAWENANIKEAISKFSEGSITIENGKVYSHGFEVNGVMANRLVHMLDEGSEGVSRFCRFYESLLKVSDKRVVEELYEFLKHNDIRLNEDGSFTGYKAVQNDYKDKYTGTIDNSVGSVIEMPRYLVDDNKHQTCSVGLHVGSEKYAVGSYGNVRGGDRIVRVKVFPEDVVSVPSDYSGMKLRACKYEVVEDVTENYL